MTMTENIIFLFSFIVLLSRISVTNFNYILGEDVNNEIAIPAAEPVSSRPKSAFNWDKTDVVEYIKSLGFPKEAAVFEEQVGSNHRTH